MSLKQIIVVFSILSVFSSSCAKPVGTTVTQSAKKQWLQNLACRFPCWENITPHETRFEEVIPVLRGAKITVYAVTEDEVEFRFQETIYGSVHKAPDGRVDPVILDLHNGGITLGDLEPLIGSPAAVDLVKALYTRDCLASLLYPDSGTIVELWSLKNYSKRAYTGDCRADIASNSKVFRILLMDKNFDHHEFWNQSPWLSLKYVDIYPQWKGYGRYP